MTALLRYAITAALFLAWPQSGAWAADRPIKDFYGTFVGQTMADGSSKARESSVTIEPLDKQGFSVAWTTTIPRKDGTVSEKTYKINFQHSNRKKIYAAAMRKNLFGGWVPLDPMKGDPYVWARLEGNTLTVYAMIVIDDGGYEMQTYERTLTDDGNLLLEFRRVRDGVVMKTIEGRLVRQKK